MGSAHTLKTWPAYFAAVLDGSKTFEVRSHLDRTFRLGDEMELAEFDPHAGDGGQFTGRTVKVVITYILGGGQFGIDTGVCVLGIKLVPIDDLTALRAENARLRAALLRLADDDSDEAYAARAALDAKDGE